MNSSCGQCCQRMTVNPDVNLSISMVYEVVPALVYFVSVYWWNYFSLPPPSLYAVFCRVYITEHSYVSVKTKVSTSAQEILKIVAEKLQNSQEDLALVAVSFSGGKLFSAINISSFSPCLIWKRALTFSIAKIGLFPYGSTAGWP